MGLFNRGSKSDTPLSGDEWSTNGGPHKPAPTEAERVPAPASEPKHEPEAAVEETPLVEETPEVEEIRH
jgi:hypothetical protein